MNEIEIETPNDTNSAAPAPTRAEIIATFNNLRVCNELERILHRGPGRQPRRLFERLFAKHWPNIDPQPQHPRLALVIERYKERTRG